MNGLAQRLKEARKQSGLSQEKLAEAIGVSGHAIYLFERGKNRPALDTLERIAAGHRAGYRVVLRRRLCRPGRRPRADLECRPGASARVHHHGGYWCRPGHHRRPSRDRRMMPSMGAGIDYRKVLDGAQAGRQDGVSQDAVQESTHGPGLGPSLSWSPRAAMMTWRTQADPPSSITRARTSGGRRRVRRGAPWPS